MDHRLFKPTLETDYEVSAGETRLPIRLVELRMIETGFAEGEVPEHFRKEPFALLFTGPQDQPLDQGLYNVRHAELGELALFVVPVGTDRRGRLYESVFN